MGDSVKRYGRIILAAVSGVLSAIAALAALSSYTVTDLGSLNGGGSEAFGINESGQVVGWTSGDTQQWPFFHDGTTLKAVAVEPSTYPSTANEARAVNGAGEVAGTINPPLRVRAFRYSNGVATELPPLEGGWSSNGYGINSAGQVVGASTAKDGLEHACLWDGTAARDLGTFGGSVGRAFAVNNSGHAVGTAQTAGGQLRAFLYDGVTLRDLGPGSAECINAAGLVAGQSGAHGFLWDGAGRKDLGTLGGSTSIARGVNEAGQVVGGADTARNERHAFLYEGGQMRDLNDVLPPDSGVVLQEAAAINNAGQIVGRALIKNTTRAFRMTPRQGETVVELSPPYPAPSEPIDWDCSKDPDLYVCSGGDKTVDVCFIGALSGWGGRGSVR